MSQALALTSKALGAHAANIAQQTTVLAKQVKDKTADPVLDTNLEGFALEARIENLFSRFLSQGVEIDNEIMKPLLKLNASRLQIIRNGVGFTLDDTDETQNIPDSMHMWDAARLFMNSTGKRPKAVEARKAATAIIESLDDNVQQSIFAEFARLVEDPDSAEPAKLFKTGKPSEKALALTRVAARLYNEPAAKIERIYNLINTTFFIPTESLVVRFADEIDETDPQDEVSGDEQEPTTPTENLSPTNTPSTSETTTTSSPSTTTDTSSPSTTTELDPEVAKAAQDALSGLDDLNFEDMPSEVPSTATSSSSSTSQSSSSTSTTTTSDSTKSADAQKKRELDTALVKKKSEVDTAQKQLTEAQTSAASANDKRTAKKKEYDIAEAQNNTAADEAQKLRSVYQAAEQVCGQSKVDITNKKGDLAAAAKTFSEKFAQFDAAKKVLQTLVTGTDKGKVQAQTVVVNSLKQEVLNAKNAKEAAEKSVKELEVSFNAKEAAMKDADSLASAAEEGAKSKKTALETLQKELNEAQTALDGANAVVSLRNSSYQKALKEHEALQPNTRSTSKTKTSEIPQLDTLTTKAGSKGQKLAQRVLEKHRKEPKEHKYEVSAPRSTSTISTNRSKLTTDDFVKASQQAKYATTKETTTPSTTNSSSSASSSSSSTSSTKVETPTPTSSSSSSSSTTSSTVTSPTSTSSPASTSTSDTSPSTTSTSPTTDSVGSQTAPVSDNNTLIKQALTAFRAIKLDSTKILVEKNAAAMTYFNSLEGSQEILKDIIRGPKPWSNSMLHNLDEVNRQLLAAYRKPA